MEPDNGLTASEAATPTFTPSRSSIFRNRLSTASLLSLSSIRTFLPQYSVIDNLESSAGAASDDSPESPPYSPSTSSISSQTAIDPPHYSVPLISSSSHPDVDVVGEFRYSYPIRTKKPWATFHLLTRDAVPGNPKPLQCRPRVPRLWSCRPIRGILELDLDSPQNIQHIKMSVNGNIIMSSLSEGSLPFLGRQYTLWDKSMGDPLQCDVSSTQRRKVDGRFVPGKYKFPFSVPFPTNPDPISKSTSHDISIVLPFPPVTVGSVENAIAFSTSRHDNIPKEEEKKRRGSWTSRFASSSISPSVKGEISDLGPRPSTDMPPHPSTTSLASLLPQSFVEKGISHNIAYDISVCIVHGIFKASSRIRTDIQYLPASQPHPTPQKRREAYETGGPLPCPLDDPEGWFVWPTLTMYGVINPSRKPRHTKVHCTIYLARHLSYTRGSVIPCFLTIYSDDGEVADLLVSPKTPVLRLLRRIRHPAEGSDQLAEESLDEHRTPLSGGWSHITTLPTGAIKLVSHEVGRAQWWIPAKHVTQSPSVKHLEGEIHLSPSLQPSCDFQLFKIEYAVEFLSFQTDDFELESHPSSRRKSQKKDKVFASNPVEITSLFRADEPTPIVYSEPPKINIMRRVNLDDNRATMIHEEDE